MVGLTLFAFFISFFTNFLKMQLPDFVFVHGFMSLNSGILLLPLFISRSAELWNLSKKNQHIIRPFSKVLCYFQLNTCNHDINKAVIRATM